MRKGAVALLAVCVALVLAAFWLRFRCRQPEKFLELSLKLAKRQWRLGEHPWYLLQIKNVGCKTVLITDPFWVDQDYLIQNYDARPSPFGPNGWLITKQRTFFELTDPKGVELHSGRPSWGFHGEHKFWTNDCGDGKECKTGDHPRLELKPGETLTATPSMVLPIQPPDKGDPFIRDGRDLPRSLPPNLPPDKLEKLRQEWRQSIEDLMLMGDIRHPTDSS
ncbi:MAG: hypothetical protein HZB91_14695, partial [Elusimicrobia bacterium]|nr:hypothetical protein [Elusimicrobiota bacterium]